MKPIGETNLDLQAGAASTAWRRRALQITSAARDLGGKAQDPPHQSPPDPGKDPGARLRQSGTPGAVPFRHEGAPRLTAAFTAQLLGQILPDPERRPSAAGAYDRQALPLPLGYDTRL